MREILFRGKRVDNGEWVEGELLHDMKGRPWIYWTTPKELPIFFSRSAIVKSETIGQYIGLKDKNGTKIFEGDIIECDVFGAMVTVEHRKYLVAFENGTYIGQWSIGEHKFSTYMHETWGRNVVGNKWDNSELLEVMR